jgi:RNA polymerase sigma-70 factor (ECF subfamily)
MEAPSGLDDRSLVRSLALGHVWALDVLFDRYSALAFSFAYRMLGDRGRAEEVVQDSFVALWRHAARYQAERGSARCWLLRIVRNRCVDHLRWERARPRYPLAGVAGAERLLEGPGTADASEEALKRLAGEEVRRALACLPAEQRRAIELAYFDGYTHHEIAERLNLPLGTVKGRLRLGLQKLQARLTPLAADLSA